MSRLTVMGFLRIARGLTQEKTGRILDISQPRYSRIERGEQQPSLGEAIRIAEFFDRPIHELLERARLVSKAERDFLDAVESERDIVSNLKEIERSKKRNGETDFDEFQRITNQVLHNIRKERRRRERRLPTD